ncbi:Clp protease N-terminal domain-containing protein [Streptomyces sp. NPDC004980]
MRCRHIAESLLGAADSRAVEVLLMRRVDLTAMTGSLQSVALTEKGHRPESHAVARLRRARRLGGGGRQWTRTVMSLTPGGTGDRGPVLPAIRYEAARQAVRAGRRAVEPVDLLLAVTALDRALTVDDRCVPQAYDPLKSAAGALRAAGVRPDALAAATAVVPPVPPASGDTPFTPEAEEAMTTARSAGTGSGSGTADTAHLLAALLNDPKGSVGFLLREQGADLDSLRAQLGCTRAS